MKMRNSILAAIALALPPLGAEAQLVVTNFTSSVYAVVTDPMGLSFAADGTLYCGRDNSGSGGGSSDALKISRVAPGGSPVTQFGNVAVADPDAVIVDLAGAVSGTAGAVLVGGDAPGKISKISPDGTVTTLFGPSADYANPSAFAFDASGRLLFTAYDSGRVYVSSGGTPVLLFALSHVNRVAVDAAARIVVNSDDETRLRLYTSSGALSNANFATVKSGTPLARGAGGAWGADIYAVGTGGELLRIGLSGGVTNIGSGFSNVRDLRFGPDGALYASDFANDRIYRFAQPSLPQAATTVYSRVTDPTRMAFAPDGTMFVGRDNSGSGGDFDDPVKVFRVASGGAPSSEYGNAPISDPDGVAYDANGSASGISGAVIVGGHELNSLAGKVVAIRPDQTITTLYATASTFNPNVFAYDRNGRLLFSDDEGGKVWTMTNGTPTVLFNLAGAVHLAADSLNRIVVGVSGTQTLRLYTAAGALLTNAFATVAADSPLAPGPGGFWGTGMFCVNTNGDLLSLDLTGVATKFGSGFGAPYGMSFGPDGALYVTDFGGDLIWRVAPAVDRPRLEISQAGAHACVSWQSFVNLPYQLQSSTNLTSAAWLNEGLPFPGTGGVLVTNILLDRGPNRFFRLRAGD